MFIKAKIVDKLFNVDGAEFILIDSDSIRSSVNREVAYYELDGSLIGEAPISYFEIPKDEASMVPVIFDADPVLLVGLKGTIYLDFTTIGYSSRTRALYGEIYKHVDRTGYVGTYILTHFKSVKKYNEENNMKNMKAVRFTEEFSELTHLPREVVYIDTSENRGDGAVTIYSDINKEDTIGTVAAYSIEDVEEVEETRKEESDPAEGIIHSLNGVEYIMQKRSNNSDVLSSLGDARLSLLGAINAINYSPFVVNMELSEQLESIREDIRSIHEGIRSGQIIIREPAKLNKYYYRLGYFFDRKNTGSIYIESEKNVSEFEDEDAFLSYLADDARKELVITKDHEDLLDKYINSIYQITEISKEEYMQHTK